MRFESHWARYLEMAVPPVFRHPASRPRLDASRHESRCGRHLLRPRSVDGAHGRLARRGSTFACALIARIPLGVTYNSRIPLAFIPEFAHVVALRCDPSAAAS